MSAFERSYKLIYKATITGNPVEIKIDNVFDHTRSLYVIMFTQYYYNTGGTHDQWNLRRNGTTNTDSDVTRSSVVLQHGQGSAIYQGNTSNATLSTGAYAGSAETERGNTITYYNPSNRGILPSYYQEAIGFVKGTDSNIDTLRNQLIEVVEETLDNDITRNGNALSTQIVEASSDEGVLFPYGGVRIVVRCLYEFVRGTS